MGYGAVRELRKVLAAGLFTACGFAATAEPVVIAALGDSLTQGYGLVEQDGFVPQLTRWLTAQGVEAKVINAGVSGDTTAGGAARVDWTLTPEIDAMIVALGGNDVLRGIDPSLTRANLETILQSASNAGVPVLLVGMQAPGNYGQDYKNAFDAIYPDLAGRYETVYAPNFFEGLSIPEDADAATKYMQADGIHPNAKGITLIVGNLGPAVLELVAAANLQE
ncbi:MAG: arylesterase [Ruegeria sp.]